MNCCLAVYTAEHGLAWKAKDISLAELDVCRTLLAPLPDFDSGDVGYEGVAALGERVFVIRCFKVEKWDFRGRDAVYLVVAWMPRSLAGFVDFEAILRSPQMTVPTHDEPQAFEVEFPVNADFEIGHRIAETNSGATLRFVRHLDGSRKWSETMTEAERFLTSKEDHGSCRKCQSPAERHFGVDGNPVKGDDLREAGVANGQVAPSKVVRIVVAILICVVLLLIYGCIGACLGWRHSGGYIPMAILLATMGCVWRFLTKDKS